MSTFSGITREYPEVAIDYFSGKQILKARAYFLSHVHTDHTVGLHSSTFANHLENHPTYKLYCSEVTREFLLTSSKHRHLKKSLLALPVEQRCDVFIPNDVTGEKEKLQVTLLPAGHCPGSVMFLLEGYAGKVLYTGDFRFKIGDAASMDALHDGEGVKALKSLYIDTTFFDPKIMFIPNREQSCEAMLRVIEEQLQRGPRHMVHIKCRAKYGYEYLFIEISRAFGMKVHVSGEIMKQYERVSSLAEHMTTEGSATRVHACRKYACTLKDAVDVITITPSTMWFNSNAQPDDVLKKISSHYYRLCFSFHSSYSEICDFIQYLKPTNIYPNVIPYNSTEYQMIERLENVLNNVSEVDSSSSKDKYKPLGSLMAGKKRKRKRGQCKEHVQSRSLEVLFGDGSPTKPKKFGIIDREGEYEQLKHKPNDTGDEERSDNLEVCGELCEPFTSGTGTGAWIEEDEGTSESLFSEDENAEWDIEEVSNRSSFFDEGSLAESFIDDPENPSSISSPESSQADQSPLFKSFAKYLPSADVHETKNNVKHLPKDDLWELNRERRADGAAVSGYEIKTRIVKRDLEYDFVGVDRQKHEGTLQLGESKPLSVASVSPLGESTALSQERNVPSCESIVTSGESVAPSNENLASSCVNLCSKFAIIDRERDKSQVGALSGARNDMGIHHIQNGSNNTPPCIESNYDIGKLNVVTTNGSSSARGELLNAEDRDSINTDVTSAGSYNKLSEEGSSQDSISPIKSFLQYLPGKSYKEDARKRTEPSSKSRQCVVEAKCNNKITEIETMKKPKCSVKENVIRLKNEPDDKLVNLVKSAGSRSPVYAKTGMNSVRIVADDELNKCTLNAKLKMNLSTEESSNGNGDFICHKAKSENFYETCSHKRRKHTSLSTVGLVTSAPEDLQCHENVSEKSQIEDVKGKTRSPNSCAGMNVSRENCEVTGNVSSRGNVPDGDSGVRDVPALERQEILYVDLTESDERDLKSEVDEEELIISSQNSETTVVLSPSIKSSQETYLSPSKLQMCNSQEIFLLSSPEASDAPTPDCIELL
ncbi:uncharacterized protein [Apostichopus japonicus]|uniref:uncharacterized protein n=1 Tax=Stichopus japonicus TaxID=307972 RepID=UPI003AB28E32